MSQAPSREPVLLRDYRPPAFATRQAELEFDLDPAATVVTSRQSIERDPKIAGQGARPVPIEVDHSQACRPGVQGRREQGPRPGPERGRCERRPPAQPVTVGQVGGQHRTALCEGLHAGTLPEHHLQLLDLGADRVAGVADMLCRQRGHHRQARPAHTGQSGHAGITQPADVRSVGRHELLHSLWRDSEEVPNERTIDVHIRRLRSKLGRLANTVRTVRGQGYRFYEHPEVVVWAAPEYSI